MKATDLLKKQHRKVEQLFAKIEASGSADAVEELANELAAHMAIEQEILYPAISSVDAERVAESFEEHAVAELELKRLLRTSEEDEAAFKARVVTLKELIGHHVTEEEEELFPKVEKKMARETLDDLAERMKARFDEALDAGYEAVLPKGPSKTSADRKKPASLRPHAG